MSRGDRLHLVDTSVAVALVVQDHSSHTQVSAATEGLTLGLAGHAAFETFSVLTRLPPPLRRDPATVRDLIDANFPMSRFLSREGATALLGRLPELGISGGSVYDALIAAAAVAAGATLHTRDNRALKTYRALNADVNLID